MARLNERVTKLESHLHPEQRMDVRLLFAHHSDFDQQLADAKAAGAFAIVIRGISPAKQDEAH